MLQIQFLGGAGGVGATCQLLTIAGRHILVDAGVRMGGVDRLPDLAALDGHDLAAIFITHAHADHIGALPLIAGRYPGTPIYATPATIRLMEVMLADAVRVMARRAADELEWPLYDDAQVAALLAMLRPLVPGAQQVAALPDVAVHVQRAGHIAGAVSLGFASDAGRLVISGDVSATPQRTILGAAVPAPKYPDLLVLESTYGARLHPNRAQEERRLAEAVAEVIARGGHCLIPAFALGRAQEVILILRAAQRDGHIPPFPIAVDGLVRSVCATYTAIPDALTPALRRHILGGATAFFGGTVRAIETPRQRENLLAGPPSAIVTSSGMLTGGPSVWYAERLVGDPQAAVFFSGYLDEEAPGRQLLDLAEAPTAERRLVFGDRTVPVACQIGRYSLSAHADGDELTGLVRALGPKTVALVHGDAEARAALAARLRDSATVVLPQDGQTLTIAASPQGRRVQLPAMPTPALSAAVGGGAPFDADGVERLWAALRDGTGVQALSVRELARAWSGEPPDAETETQIVALLEAGTVYFRALPGALGLWRLLAPTEVRRAQASQTSATGHSRPGSRIDQAGIQTVIDHHLGNAPDLYQRSIDPATGTITLRYFFPDVARDRDAAAHAAIAAEAGVTVTVSPQPHQAQLAAAALAALPPGVTPERAPAIRVELKAVEVRCAGQTDETAIVAASERFTAQTGWQLIVRGAGLPPTAAEPATPDGLETFEPPPGTPRAEVNWALDSARAWFGPDTGCYKIGADQGAGVLTLRFAFPDVARTTHAARLAKLAAVSGWQVRIWPQVHQEALMQAARAALPPGLTSLGAPALQSTTREVVVRVQGEADDADLAARAAQFAAATGWQLILRKSAPVTAKLS